MGTQRSHLGELGAEARLQQLNGLVDRIEEVDDSQVRAMKKAAENQRKKGLKKQRKCKAKLEEPSEEPETTLDPAAKKAAKKERQKAAKKQRKLEAITEASETAEAS